MANIYVPADPPPPRRWQCSACSAIGEETPQGFDLVGPWTTLRANGGVIVAAVHTCDTHALLPDRHVAFLLPPEPDELAKLTRDEVIGLAVSGLRRTLPADKAERVISELNVHMTWGSSIDHDTQEMCETLINVMSRANSDLMRLVSNENSMAYVHIQEISGIQRALHTTLLRARAVLVEQGKIPE